MFLFVNVVLKFFYKCFKLKFTPIVVLSIVYLYLDFVTILVFLKKILLLEYVSMLVAVSAQNNTTAVFLKLYFFFLLKITFLLFLLFLLFLILKTRCFNCKFDKILNTLTPLIYYNQVFNILFSLTSLFYTILLTANNIKLAVIRCGEFLPVFKVKITFGLSSFVKALYLLFEVFKQLLDFILNLSPIEIKKPVTSFYITIKKCLNIIRVDYLGEYFFLLDVDLSINYSCRDSTLLSTYDNTTPQIFLVYLNMVLIFILLYLILSFILLYKIEKKYIINFLVKKDSSRFKYFLYYMLFKFNWFYDFFINLLLIVLIFFCISVIIWYSMVFLNCLLFLIYVCILNIL